MNAPSLTPERARELAKIGGFVRLPKIEGAQHKSSGQVISVINDRKIEVKPWAHGRTEVVALADVTEHKSKTAKHQEIVMQRRSLDLVDPKQGVSLPYAMLSSVGMGDIALGSIAPPKKPEPFVVIDPQKLLVWGGPEGRNRGFNKTIERAAEYADSAAAARSIGKLKHAKGWKSVINPDGLVPMPKSEAAKLLANRPKSASPPPVITVPSPVATSPSPEATEPMQAAVVPTPVHPNGHGKSVHEPFKLHLPPKPAVEVKPPVVPDPPATPKPPIVIPSAPKEMTGDVMEIVASMAQDYRDFETAIGMAEEARKNIMRKMGMMQEHMSGRMASVKG